MRVENRDLGSRIENAARHAGRCRRTDPGSPRSPRDESRSGPLGPESSAIAERVSSCFARSGGAPSAPANATSTTPIFTCRGAPEGSECPRRQRERLAEEPASRLAVRRASRRRPIAESKARSRRQRHRVAGAIGAGSSDEALVRHPSDDDVMTLPRRAIDAHRCAARRAIVTLPRTRSLRRSGEPVGRSVEGAGLFFLGERRRRRDPTPRRGASSPAAGRRTARAARRASSPAR